LFIVVEFMALRSLGRAMSLKVKTAPNTACTGQVRARPTLSGKAAPTADSASGGFSRQFPRLPVTPFRWALRVKMQQIFANIRVFFSTQAS